MPENHRKKIFTDKQITNKAPLMISHVKDVTES